MSETIIAKLTLESLRETLQLAGYRVEMLTDPVTNAAYLRSATGGLGFDIRPGSPLNDAEQSFVDFAIVAALHVQSELPLDLVNRWNVTRRFGRLQFSQPFLILTQDVSVGGGVAPNHVRGLIGIWDQLLQQLIPYLREELARIAAGNGAVSPAAGPALATNAAEQGRTGEPDAPVTIQ